MMDSKRLVAGFGWGVVGTLAMSVLMLTGVAMGISPMPKPIPLAVVGQVLGPGTPQLLLMALAIIAHLTYGGFWGAVLAALTRPVTVWKGLGMGVAVWFLMQILVLPFIGWGFFGLAVTPMIAAATLMLHLVYGGTTGWLGWKADQLETGEVVRRRRAASV